MSKRSPVRYPDAEGPVKRARMSPSNPAGPSTQQAAVPPGLTINNATETLQRYIGWLRNQPKDGMSFTFKEVVVNGKQQHIACCKLPFNCPVREVHCESSYPTPQMAKRGASFNAVCELYAAGEIDAELMPTPSRPSKEGPPPSALKAGGLPALKPDKRANEERVVLMSGQDGPRAEPRTRPMDAARDAARDLLPPKRHTSEHDVLNTPAWWSRQPPITTAAYGSVLTIEFPQSPNLSLLCRQLCLVTSQPLPHKEQLVLTLPNLSQRKQHAPVARLQVSAPLQFTPDQLDLAFEWTRVTVRCITNQPIDGLLETAPYLFLPLSRSFSARACLASDVAWDDVAAVKGDLCSKLDLADSAKAADILKDAVLTYQYELGRRHYVIGVRTDLTPHSPAPRRPDISIVDLVKTSHEGPARVLHYPNQPIAESEQVVSARNGSFVSNLNQPKPVQHLISEFYYLHFLPASVMRTGTMIPSVMNVLNDDLIARQCNEDIFGGALNNDLLLQALTCPAYRGPPHNYERLEMLGDTILHFLASLDVYNRAEPAEEGEADGAVELIKNRHLIVSNRTLGPAGVSAGIVKYIRYKAPSRSELCPPGWIDEEAEDDASPSTTTSYTLGEKIPADVTEAIVGAAFVSHGAKVGDGKSVAGALRAAHALHIPLQLQSLDELTTGSVVSRLLGKPTSNGPPLSVFGQVLSDPSKARAVLQLPPTDANFEQLKFLGNAALELLATVSLWKDKDLSPAELTVMKHSRVSNESLAAFAASEVSGLAGLIDVAPHMQEAFHTFIAEIRAAEMLGDVQNQSLYWRSIPTLPNLGAVVQALFGAILVSSGFDLGRLNVTYYNTLLPWLHKYCQTPSRVATDPKSRLNLFMQRRGCRNWSVERSDAQTLSDRVTDVFVHGRRVARGTGRNIHTAMKTACDEAIEALSEGLPELCTCPRPQRT